MSTKKNFSLDKFESILKVGPEHDGHRLDQFMKAQYSTFSREFIKRKISKSEVSILGRPTPHRPSVRVKEGDQVVMVTFNQKMPMEYWNGQPMELDQYVPIIFEDEQLVVASKPAHMLTHPTGRHLFHCLTIHLSTAERGAVYNVHRLDRETSGLILLGKNKFITNQLTQLFELNQVQKAYFLIAEKRNKNLNFPIVARENIGKPLSTEESFELDLFMKAYPYGHKEGKSAQTTFHLICENERYIIAMAFPKTGRQHQIRVHAAANGFPLLGDKLYLQDHHLFLRIKDNLATYADYQALKIPRHALHAYAVSFPYPHKKSTIFVDQIPTDLAQWITDHFQQPVAQIENQILKLIENKWGPTLKNRIDQNKGPKSYFVH